jgi:predicted enzyme related to lactoylglutathione lyase
VAQGSASLGGVDTLLALDEREVMTMLKDAKTFSSFSVNDLQAAKQFYGETLGLDVKETDEGLDLHPGGGNEIFIYPKHDHVPATFTILNFQVDDVEKTVDALTAKGIRFEHYDGPHIRTDAKGIAHAPDGPTIAWFKDPAGNFISVLKG